MACRVYDLDRHSIIDLDLPERYWPSDWSAGERRLLVAVRDAGQPIRLGWVNIDGSGDPEFITSADEFPSLGRLSPEGGRILCRIGPVSPPGVSPETRLHVVDLVTGNRTLLDEPGLSCGYCWSADGSRIAYTWQPTLAHPDRVSERQTLLVTCNADGSNRTVVTSRKYTIPSKVSGRPNYPIFFTVLDWR